MGAPNHMHEPGKLPSYGLTGDTSIAPQNHQVNKTFEHKNLTDLVRSDDGQELDEGRVEACGRITDPDPHPHGQGEGEAEGGGGQCPPSKCSKWCPIVINSRAEHLNVGIRELSDYNVTIHLSREGNWLQKGNNWVKFNTTRKRLPRLPGALTRTC